MLALSAAMIFSATPLSAQSQPVIVYSNWGTLQQPIIVRAGYTNVPFTVEFQNDTTSIIYAQLNLSSTPFTNSTGGTIARSVPSSLNPAVFTFTLNIKSSANAEIYSMPIKLVKVDGSSYNYTVKAQVTAPPSVAVTELYWGISSSIYPYPGYGNAPLTALISNPDTEPIYHVTLSLQLPYFLQSQTGGSTERFYISEIAPGSFEPVTSEVNITQLSMPGTYIEPYVISYTDSNGAHFINSGTVKLIIYPETELQVNMGSPSVVQGEYASMLVTVKNTGTSPIYNLAVSLQTQGISIVRGNTTQVNLLAAGSSTCFQYSVYAPQTLPAGIYPINVNVQYGSAGSVSQESYVTYASVLSQTQAAYVSVQPGSIYYMRNNSITIYVKNAINQVLKNVQLQISPAQSIYISGGYGPFSLGTIQPYGEANLTLNVLPYFSQPQVYPLEINLDYDGSSNYTQSIAQTVPIYIGGIITINISQVQMPLAYNGSSESVSGTILNSGTEEAYYGTIYINSSALGITQSQYIGDLPTDSPTPFSFSIYVPSSAQGGIYPVTLSYQYKDSLGNTYSAVYSTSMQVISGRAQASSAPSNHGFVSLLTVIITVIIIAVIIFVFVRRFRR